MRIERSQKKGGDEGRRDAKTPNLPVMLAIYENREIPFVFYADSNSSFHSHLHRQVEMLLVSEGRIATTVSGREYLLEKGDLVIVFPHEVHSYETKGFSAHSVIIFDMEYAGEYAASLASAGMACPVIKGEQVHQDILYCMDSLKRLDGSLIPSGVIKGYISVILGRAFEVSPIERKKQSSSTDIIHRALLYITEHFTEQISLETVATSIGASKYYLSRIFSNEIGIHFSDYVNSLRVLHAQHLLGNPSLTVTDIGYNCGFNSQRTFNRAFREHCGITPTEHRKKLIQ